MRHRMKIKRIGRPTDQRVAMLKTLVTKLFLHGKLTSTELKAKETKRLAEKVLTTARENDLAAKRRVRRIVHEADAFKRVFEVYVPKYKDHPGGYLSITKLPPRRGDGASMALLTFVEKD